ncbi:uncharacterized protein MAM_04407 [Metarhizium album ARSEF 1941]|uniref:Uncharacterized protein n=1 Tax=Metarhizium album (strain ARSEF 1941) TaxID=1081103 RepID=A0A0B2WVB8_METAS|nr:uncharacterized protein MAM_04407 [Metarhizium album ARSEF 1941]KHN98018.1 hypothetical protein MAM_04407 [Metarhizium album ARSEF 1941]
MSVYDQKAFNLAARNRTRDTRDVPTRTRDMAQPGKTVWNYAMRTVGVQLSITRNPMISGRGGPRELVQVRLYAVTSRSGNDPDPALDSRVDADSICILS